MHRLELKTELLCFLALSEIFAFCSRGAWLQIDHLVESTRIWLRRHDHHAEWHERIQLSRMAADLARQLVDAGDIVHGQRDAYWFFTSDMQINFASPRVIAVYAQCVNALARRY
ncbi:hypothetical protein [Paraburkholderia caffeinilytica]|uniref:hypothetical protein n=1 Tax=Paraburkholderia caffeinilytica TaxID=1761016 RepID=UPI003DA0F92C